MKEQKGITLIALVITIIVLLILAGVSIAMLTGQNGILTQANNSKTETVKAEAIEKINLTLNTIKTEIYKQQVSNSTYNPAASDTAPNSAIITVLTNDGVKPEDEKADDVYWYTMAGGLLTIHYKNSTINVTEVAGSINLKDSSYTITKAATVPAPEGP